MGIIQNAVTQMLGTVGIAARLAPGYETRQELHNLGKQEKALKEQAASLNVDPFEYEEGKTIEAKQAREIAEKQAKVKQRQFELKPSKQTAAQASMYRSGAGEGPLMTFTDYEDMLGNAWETEEEARQANALIEASNKNKSKQTQKRNFKDYIGQLETSLGGTVSDLPESVQKAIAKQYTRGEKVKLMNKMDKESKK